MTGLVRMPVRAEVIRRALHIQIDAADDVPAELILVDLANFEVAETEDGGLVIEPKGEKPQKAKEPERRE